MSEKTTRILRGRAGVTATRRLRTPMLYERFQNPREPVTVPEETDSMPGKHGRSAGAGAT
jgi:hypothetical protein